MAASFHPPEGPARPPLCYDADMCVIRPATPADEAVLWRMLAHAAWVGPGEDVREVPYLARFVTGWGRPGDLGLIAQSGAGHPLGAGWLRLLVGDERRSSAYVGPDVPELSLAVEPGARGAGLGTRLLTQLLDRARATGRYDGVVLTTRTENPAVRLYRRVGFVQTGVIANRVGGSSRHMVLRFASVPPQSPKRLRKPE